MTKTNTMNKILISYKRKTDIPEAHEYLKNNRILYWGKDIGKGMRKDPPYEVYLILSGVKQYFINGIGIAIDRVTTPIVDYIPQNWPEYKQPDHYSNYFVFIELDPVKIPLSELTSKIDKPPENFIYLN